MPVSFSRLSSSTSTASPALTVTSPRGLVNSRDRDLAFGLVADVDDGVVLGHLDDGALDDLAFLEDALAAALLERGFEHRGEIFFAASIPICWFTFCCMSG